jgi:hypothetical protein
MIIARLRTAILALACMVLPGSALAASPAPACSGEDLVAKMQREEPARYKAMLDHFATIKNGEGIFWKLEKPGVPPSYLFGTAHVTDDRVLDRLADVTPILRDARALIVEVADLNPNLSRQMAIIQQYGMLPEGETLEDRLGKDDLVQRAPHEGRLPAGRNVHTGMRQDRDAARREGPRRPPDRFRP